MQKILPYIILPIILMILGNHDLLSQADLVDISIQYNNEDDKKSDHAIEIEDISEKKVDFDEMLNTTEFYESGNITLQIVFYDRTTLGPFQLKEKHKNVTAETYVTKWNAKHSNEKRILMLFVKDQHDGNYEFTNFEVSNLPHIFPVVKEYIQGQIMAQSDSTAKVINDGLNALKNAYDDQFKKRLVEMGPKMMDFKYYYKGYSYIPHPYYYFEYVETSRNSELNNKLEYWHNPGQNSTYFDLYLKNWPNRKATVFNADFGQDLMYKRAEQTINLDDFETVYVKTVSEEGTGSHLFEEYPNHFQMKDLFDLENCSYSSISEIPENSDLHELAKELSTSQSIIKMKIVESDYKESYKKVTIGNPVYYKSSYKLFRGDLKGVNRNNLWKPQDVSKVTSKMGWGVGWNFDQNLATWCNVFACDLSNYIYGKVKGDYPVPYGDEGMTAKQLNSHFTSEFNNYINLREEEENYGPEKIWGLIDAGYPIYFSTSNHIETGFPDESKNTGNKKYFNESRRFVNNNPASRFCTIGAGSLVGYTTYKNYFFLNQKKTKVFLYLEYLKKKY